MEDREVPQMRKYGKSEMTRIMMATARHVTSSSGLRKLQVACFLFNRGNVRSSVVCVSGKLYL